MLVFYILVLMKYIFTKPEAKATVQHQEPYESNTHDKIIVSPSKPPSLNYIKAEKKVIARTVEASKELQPLSTAERNQSEPDDSVTAIVQCSTSRGNLTIDVRGHWAPLGSKQYLELVEENLFTDLPFFRVCPRYITQFGAKYNLKTSVTTISDDPSLWGVRDMDIGYIFFAVSFS